MSGLACGTCGHGICNCPTESELGVQLWWHAFGGVREDMGCWQLVVIGPGTAAPKVAAEMEISGSPYLASWDHAPSDAEKDEITPEDYRDEAPDDEYDDADDVHDALHPWLFAGCGDCDERADRLEAERTP